ncbi:MAG: hypothetical protein ABFD08_19605 [Syntrophomonas sp.]
MNINIKPLVYYRISNKNPGYTVQTASQLTKQKQKLDQQRMILESCLLNTYDLASIIFNALSQRQGFSFIRLGDSELLVLAQDTVFPTSTDISKWGDLLAILCCDPDLGQGDNEVSRWEYIVKVSGNQFPDKTAQEYLIKAVLSATVLGIPSAYRPGRSLEHVKLLKGFQTVFMNILQKLSIPFESLRLTDSAQHHMLHANGWFRRLLLPHQYPGINQLFGLPAGYQPRILLVGNLSLPFAEMLKNEGCDVTASIQPVGMYNIEQVLSEIQKYSFDLALVSAGTAAKYICTSIARGMGKVALDTGQLLDVLLFEYGHLNNQNFKIPFFSFM